MKKSYWLIFLFICVNAIANAAPVYNSDNGHWYERIDAKIDWDQAKTQAENMTHMGMSGHLATITSYEENWWIVAELGGADTLDHWLGGYLDESTDEWKWITGEQWGYTNWWSGGGWIEPSGDGNALQFDDVEGNPPVPGYWNDRMRNAVEDGFIVEFVPIPGAVWLLGSGLIALVGLRKKIRK